MSRIRILPEILSNKIAAGEVVERPASVLKELMENARDARSRRIVVEVEKGGRKRVQVSDDGIGMNRDEALLCLERYATSKIATEADLWNIRTLGFRGEALPSIAAVSRLTLTTRDEDSDEAVRIFVEGGTICKVTELGAPVGTVMSVRDLFFNTPARRKHLKTINTEMGHITETFTAQALASPDVHFKLVHNGRTVREWPAADPMQRVREVMGPEPEVPVLRVERHAGDVGVSGWVLPPSATRSTGRGILLFVNGRYIRDARVQGAVLDGFRERLMKGRYPVAVLFIETPFDKVDVNVHPTKHLVRFAEPAAIFAAVRTGVRSALEGFERPPKTVSGSKAEPPAVQRWPEPEAEPRFEMAEPVADFIPFRPNLVPVMDRPPEKLPERQTGPSLFSAPLKPDVRQGTAPPFVVQRILGQIFDTYILCETTDALVILDQHAAHERIVYERLVQRARSGETPVQKRLVPEAFDLSAREADVLTRLLPAFQRAGFDVDPFGDNTFTVRAAPAILGSRPVLPLIMDIIDRAIESGDLPDEIKALDLSLLLTACHSAIRAGQKLSDTEMSRLVQDLGTCENPSHCPHGRPLWLRWDRRFLEKAFHRIV